MSIKELYERRKGIRAMLEEKMDEHAAAEKKLEGMTEKAATDEELTALQEQAQALSDAIGTLVGQEEDVEAEIEEAEKALQAAGEKARMENERKKAMGKPQDYLKSKQAMEDFAGVLIATAGKDRETMRKAWQAKLAEKGITNPEVVYPEPVVSSIQDAFEAAGGIYATLKKVYGFTVFSDAMNTVDDDTGRAHQHTVGEAKLEQIITLETKEIRCEYIYKYITIPKKVLRETDSTGAVINYVLSELPQRVVMEIERAAMIGDGRAAGADGKVTSFEAVVDAEAPYTAKVTATGDMYTDLVNMVAEVRAAGAKYIVTSPQALTQLRTARDNNNALLLPIGINLKEVLGVADIFTPEWYPEPSTAAGAQNALVYAGDAYTVIGDDTIQNYENFILAQNQQEFLAELYAGGALMKPYSGAVLEVAQQA